MTDQSTYDAGVAVSDAPATEASPAPVAVAETPPSAAATPAATVPAGAVTLTAEQFQALLAAARQPAATAAYAAAAPVVRIDPSQALKVGDCVVHKGRAAVILEVLTSDRVEGDKSWVQVSYRVGVFAEDRTFPAEDFGAF